YQLRQGPDGNPYILTVYTTEDGLYSMGFIVEQNEKGERVWSRISLNKCFKLKGIDDFGTSTFASDGLFNTISYNRVAWDEFSISKVGFSPNVINKWPHLPDQMATFARQGNNKWYAGAIASHYDYPSAWNDNPPSKEEVDRFLDQRVEFLLEKIKKAGGGYIDVVSEAMWVSFDGNRGWENSPFYQTYGKDIITEVYIRAYQKALELGLTPGEDIIFLYTDYGIELPGPKSNFVYRELERSIKDIRDKLDLRGNVPLDIGIEYHIFPNDKLAGYPNALTPYNFNPQKLVENIRRFEKLGGRVNIVELQVNEVYDLKTVQETLIKAFQVAIQGKVRSLTLYQVLSTENLWKAINPQIFDPKNEFTPTAFYYRIQSICLDD
ncbi:MAG: endo-1,4-beta-xylanase, partial [Methanothermobacter tenebrarum]